MAIEKMIIEKVILGITLAAPIGPVSLEMIKRGLHKGFLSAFVIRLGGACGNFLCLMAAYFGLSMILNSDFMLGICGLIGSLVLLYLGLRSLLAKKVNALQFEQHSASYGLWNGLATGFILSITSPIGIMFWLGIFAATIDPTQHAQSWTGLLENSAIIIGVLLWGAFLSLLLEVGSRFLKPQYIKIITVIAGVMLMYFSIKYGHKAILLLTS